MIIGQIWASSKAAASIAHQLQVQVSTSALPVGRRSLAAPGELSLSSRNIFADNHSNDVIKISVFISSIVLVEISWLEYQIAGLI